MLESINKIKNNIITKNILLLFDVCFVYFPVLIVASFMYFPAHPSDYLDWEFNIFIFSPILIIFILYVILRSKEKLLLLFVIICATMGCKIFCFTFVKDIGDLDVQIVPPITNISKYQVFSGPYLKSIKDFKHLMPSGLTLFELEEIYCGSSGCTHIVILQSAKIKKDGSFEPIDQTAYMCSTVGSFCYDHLTSLRIIPFQKRQFWIERTYNHPPSGLPSHPVSKAFWVNDQGKFVEHKHKHVWTYISWITHLIPIFLFLLLKNKRKIAINASFYFILLWIFAYNPFNL